MIIKMKRRILKLLIVVMFIFIPIAITTFTVSIISTYGRNYDYEEDDYYEEEEDEDDEDEEDNDSGGGWFNFDIGKMLENWAKDKVKETSEFVFGDGIKIDGMFLKNVIYPEKNITILGKYYTEFSKFIKSISMSIIILYALWYGFKVYVLWKDGNPEENPKEMGIRFIMAMSFLLCYDEVLNIVSNIISEIISKIMEIGSGISGASLGSIFGATLSVLSIIGIIFSIIYWFQYWKMMFGTIKMGIELFVLRLGVPLACINIIHPQGSTWNAYVLTFIKNYVGICLNVLLMQIGTKIYDSTAGGFFCALWAGAFLSLANGSKDLLNQFIVSSSNGISGQQMLNMGGTAIGYGGRIAGTLARKTAQGVGTGGAGILAP